MVLVGESGVGKSSLIQQFTQVTVYFWKIIISWKKITKKTSVKVSFQHLFGSSMEKAKNPSIQGDFQQDLRATIGQSKTYHFSAKKKTQIKPQCLPKYVSCPVSIAAS